MQRFLNCPDPARIPLTLAGLIAISMTSMPSAAAAVGVSVVAGQTGATVSPGEPDRLFMTVRIQSLDPLTVRLRSLTLTNETAGPGSAADLDAELGTLRLYRDDGNSAFDAASDTLLATSEALGGTVVFDSLDAAIPPGADVPFLIVGNVSTFARDGDVLDVSIQDQNDLVFEPTTITVNSWPLDPPGSFPVDGMGARQVVVHPVGPDTLRAGDPSQLVFDVTLPANGYEADVLQQLSVQSGGTAQPGSDVSAVHLWADDGSGGFDPALDRRIGPLVFTGAHWQISGLAEPVSTAGVRVFVTVDLNALAADGRRIRMRIPQLPDPGLGMASSNDGPVDGVVENPFDVVISSADRVTITQLPQAAISVPPDTQNVVLMDLSAANRYTGARTLTGLRVHNASIGTGTPSELDSGFGLLRLVFDGNDDGVAGPPAVDPVLGFGTLQNGTAFFTGLSHVIPAAATSRLLVTGAVSPEQAADGDTLAVRIDAPADVDFSQPTTVVSSWPLSGGARLHVDGMVAAQIVRPGVPSRTLNPGEGPVKAFDLRIPRNGYRDDVLTSLGVFNAGSAQPADVGVRLWRDGGDGVFDAGMQDDVDLGAMTPGAPGWSHTALAELLGAAGARLFVAVTADSAAADSATVRLVLLPGAVQVSSNNDGPRSVPVVETGELLISRAPLLVELGTVPDVSSIGQPVNVHMIVRNVTSENVNGIAPSALAFTGTGVLTYASGPAPATLNLAPGASDTLNWTYTAAAAGSLIVSGSASGTGATTSATHVANTSSSSIHRVFEAVNVIELRASALLPSTVNRGQAGVGTFALTFTNGTSQGSSVRVRTLRLRLDDGSGGPVVPSTLVGRASVSEGGQSLLLKSALESSGSTIDLTLATPLTVPAGASASATIRFDLSDSTTVPLFRVSMDDSTFVTAEDAVSGAPVAAAIHDDVFPVQTGPARVVAPATALDADTTATRNVRAAPGAIDVPLLTLRLENPGIDGVTSDVRVGTLWLTASDSAGAPIGQLADRLVRVRVESGGLLRASRTILPGDGSRVSIGLSPVVLAQVNTPVDVRISGDLAGGAPVVFRAELRDSAEIRALDANTLTPVPVRPAVSPLHGGEVRVEGSADSVKLAGQPRFPPAIPIGATDVPAIDITVRHPGPAGSGRIRIDAITVQCRDELRQPLSPAQYVERLRVLWNGAQAGVVNSPPASGGVSVPLPGMLMEAGDTARVDIVLDVAATAPSGMLEVMVFDSDVTAYDVNSGVAVVVGAEPSAELPAVSGLTRLQPNARDLEVQLSSRMPATLASDGSKVSAALITLTNVAPAGSGDIQVRALRVRAADRVNVARALGSASAQVEACINGTVWATSAALSIDSTYAMLEGAAPLQLSPGAPLELDLRVTTRSDGGSGSVRIGLDASDIGIVQPSGALLQVQARTAPGESFPLFSEPAGFVNAGLAESYSNFPNPFAAGREPTTFAYYLSQDARVTLRVYSAGGEAVKTLLDAADRPAGLQQADTWDGRNGAGQVVRNGVFMVELLARFGDGRLERVVRKVAVVR